MGLRDHLSFECWH